MLFATADCSDCARHAAGEIKMLARKKLLSLLRKLEAFIKVPSGGKVIPRRCFYSRKKMTAQDALVALKNSYGNA